MARKQVIAYCVTQKLNTMREEDIKCLDGIHIAFGLIKNNEVYWKRKKAAKAMKRIREINKDIKIVLSIGGWGADGFSQAASTKEGRVKFAKSAILLLQEEKLDGLDIDWEYPCMGEAGIQALPEDKENFTLLLEELRNELNTLEEYKTLSIAAGGIKEFVDSTNMREAEKYLDYVQLMTYDFHNGFSQRTGHLANLYASKTEPEAPNADYAVELFVEAGVPIEKIVMGAAFYGRIWKGTTNCNNGLGQAFKGKSCTSTKAYSQLMKLANSEKSGYTRFYDEDAKACYLYNGNKFITYEDKDTLRHKLDYILANNMYGIMYWEYSNDDTFTLTQFLTDGLK